METKVTKQDEEEARLVMAAARAAELSSVAEAIAAARDFALHNWLMIDVETPGGEVLLVCGNGPLRLLIRNEIGDWRAQNGTPDNPPTLWMRPPVVPVVVTPDNKPRAARANG